MSKVLVCEIDGLDGRILNYFDFSFWDEIKGDLVEVHIPKPEKMQDTSDVNKPRKQGELAVASSPRLWGEINTGYLPRENGILGFWERKLPDGREVKLKRSWDWVKENKCEKGVTSQHLLEPGIWQQVLAEGKSVGLTTVWFTYPLDSAVRELLEEYGNWCLTDFKYPIKHQKMKAEEYLFPNDNHPESGFVDEVGAGGRVGLLKQRNPEKFYKDLLKMDLDRYTYTKSSIEKYGTPDLCMIYTRAVDGFQHQFRKPVDLKGLPKRLQDGVKNLHKIYQLEIDGIDSLWKAGDFDYLLIISDHGTYATFGENGKMSFKDKRRDHRWPAYFYIYGTDWPNPEIAECKYSDVSATIFDLLDLSQDKVKGTSVKSQLQVSGRLKDLGYM